MTYNNKGKEGRRYRYVVVQGRASEAISLMEMLIALLPQSSRTTHKQYLRDRCVKVNGVVQTAHSFPIQKGDEVVIYSVGFAPDLANEEVKILWQDEYFLLIQKEVGIPTIASKSGDKHTVYRMVADHYKQGDAREKIFLLNRLDRDTRGLILFARNREVQQEILDNWEKYILRQTFVALVEGSVGTDQGTFALPPRVRQKGKKDTDKAQKESISRRSRATFEVMERTPLRAALKINLLGRYNGIRSQLKENHFSLIGDSRSIIKGAPGIALSQTELDIKHPVTGHKHHFEIAVPVFYDKILHDRLTLSERKALKERSLAQGENMFDSLKKID